MNTIPERFDINRHALLVVDEEKRIINVVLMCDLRRAEEMFMKVVQANAASYKGYKFVAPLFSISKNLVFAMYANPTLKNTNDVLLKKGDVFSMRRQSDFQTVWNLKIGQIFGII